MIGVLVSGEGTNLQALLDAGPAGRRGRVEPRRRSARSSAPSGRGVPAAVFELDDYATREERDAAMAGWLEERGVELVVCAGYMHLLTPSFLDRFPERIVNVHPSLLPDFPGARAIEDALAAGVETTGVTVHLVDEGLDTGPDRPPGARAGRAARRRSPSALHAVEHRLLPRGR